MKRALFLTLILSGLVFSQENWQVLQNAPDSGSRFEDVFFITPEIGWTINLQGRVYKTTDGGATWILQFSSPGSAFRSIGFADSLHGWIGTLAGPPFLWQTSDGGKTWSGDVSITGATLLGICGIWAASDSIIYGAGRFNGTPRLIKTTDRGANWVSTDMSAYANTLVDCYFFNPDTGFVVGGSRQGAFPNSITAVILRTTDGGKTWKSVKTTQSAGEWCWKISFPTRATGFVSIEKAVSGTPQQNILKTTDGGLSWQEVIVGNSPRFQGIGFVSESLGWVGGAEQTYETTNGGDTWHLTDFSWENVNRFRFIADTLGYAVGMTVYKYHRSKLSSVGAADREIPGSFILYQNYPNPFNAGTTIAFDLKNTDHVSLKIYDLLGRQITTLTNEVKTAGYHQINFESGNLPSGVYFYILTAGESKSFKKMILLR